MTTKIRFLSLLLGMFYIFIVGYTLLPSGVSATLFTVLTLATLFYLGGAKTNTELLIYVIGATIAVYFSLTTNILVILINIFGITFIYSVLLIKLSTKALPKNATSYVTLLCKTFTYSLHTFFSSKSIKSFFSLAESQNPDGKLKKDTVKGILITLPLLLLFHILFANINTEYATFVAEIFNKFYEILARLMFGTFLAYVFYSLLNASDTYDNIAEYKHTKTETFLITIVSIVLLFALFSYFQSKVLFIDLSKWEFKAFSLYTQQGFWELIAVAIFGYTVSLFIINRLEIDSVTTSKLTKLLHIFTIELILISIFSFHKVVALQFLYGFKDQRILATCSIVLIFMTFVLFVGRLLHKVNPEQIFKTQYLGLLAIITVINLMNVDLVVTKLNPISYYVEGEKYKDFSYLMGNSYDNYSEWLNISKEAQETNPPQPTNYYWGFYRPICRIDWYKNEPTSYLEDKYTKLLNEYDKFPEYLKTTNLEKLGKFNLHSYKAYLVLKNNKSEIDKFLVFAKSKCKPATITRL